MFCLQHRNNAKNKWSNRNKAENDFPTFYGPDLQHNLQPGDHVIRWSVLLLYPIQIHGIVLSAGPGMVTIVDFGYSSRNGASREYIQELENEGRDRRINICTLTEQNEVDKWKKVEYGKSLFPKDQWAKIVSIFRKKGKNRIEGPSATRPTQESEINLLDDVTIDISTTTSVTSLETPELFQYPTNETALLMSILDEESDDEDTDVTVNADRTLPDLSSLLNEEEEDGNSEGSGSNLLDTHDESATTSRGASIKQTNDGTMEPCLPKSDSPEIVLARVRFLLSDEGKAVLPSHNLLFANSECIAVWAKTGRFSTIQSQIFLHSTALGNVQTTTTVAAILGAQTVTVTNTVPAAGLWGWFGFTTTTTSQVGLLALNPWIIPVLAGCGIVAVGTPYLILAHGARLWEKATIELNDTFSQCDSTSKAIL